MLKKCRSILIVVLLFCSANLTLYGQKNVEKQIEDSLTAIANSYTWVGKVSVIGFSANVKTHKIIVTANERLGYMPFRPVNVKRIYDAIAKALPSKYDRYTVSCQVDNRNIDELIPNFYRTSNVDEQRNFCVPAPDYALVTNNSRPYDLSNGLQNRHLAVWQSHGWHYDQGLARWEWQRARVFQIVEDLYTQSFVLPYLVPMLENAGANVLIPRERDTQINEVIVDNDASNAVSRYREHNDLKSWKAADGVAFANKQKIYRQGENPFTTGTYRIIPSVISVDESSRAEWIPYIPETGRYAVYVSYKTVENSADDAHYTIFHKGGKTEFTVNQTMSSGTWVYLGHFYFDRGRTNQSKVVLSNLTSDDSKVVTADAVKFGGGMGNIARSPNGAVSPPNIKSSDDSTENSKLLKSTAYFLPEVSGYPRFTEAARYWLQWAGFPDTIYSRSQGKNDYTDDFQSRGYWLNYLVGGSPVAPNDPGLHIPIDLALAFHSDAGTTVNDSIIGTLGICSVQNSDGHSTFKNGISRWASRDLTDIIQTQIVNDIRKIYAPEWIRRGIWNKSYSESRVPEVPTMLLELLSHQNFADMRYGLDPRFRFTVSRSIYKGMLKYLASANGTQYVVQPLPVSSFSSRFTDKDKVELHWVAVTDSLEPTATTDKYVLYTRTDEGAFNNGVLVNSNSLTIAVDPGKIYSFKVTAVNKGGESFPSEILSVGRAINESGEVLVVNGFDRISAPAGFVMDSTYAGFLNDIDAGVPYISDISFIGKQYEFKRNKPWVDDDAPGFGASHANYETKVIAGNSFDYPYLHGKAILAAGFSFVSCSNEAVTNDDVDLSRYKIVDLILGKQKQTKIGNGRKVPEFKTFPLALQHSIQSFCQKGGNLLLSGAYLASDLCDVENANRGDRSFVENTLKLKFRTSRASITGKVKMVNSGNKHFQKMDFNYYDQPNAVSYYVESPDAIEPVGAGGFTICRYAENNLSAAVAYDGKYKTCAFGFPFETIQSEADRDKLMESVLSFLSSK